MAAASSPTPHNPTAHQQHAKPWPITDETPIGQGSFGTVTRANATDTEGHTHDVAIKKVLQDKRYKNRELQIMRSLSHRNVTVLLHQYTTEEPRTNEVFLHLVMEYVPLTIHSLLRSFQKAKAYVPMLHFRLYAYQLLRALNYIHSLGICHRDIKPQNLLVNNETHVLKLCDFGSSKILVAGEPNVSYICSRYYRAPELIFSATEYTVSVDIWSAGCVFAEILLGVPIFPGESGVDQLIEIIKVLGTPTLDQIKLMNPNYKECKFPQVRAFPISKVLRPKTPSDVVDLIGSLLRYEPNKRLTALAAMAEPAFAPLRDPKTAASLEDQQLPILFDFSDEELMGVSDEMRACLLPAGK